MIPIELVLYWIIIFYHIRSQCFKLFNWEQANEKRWEELLPLDSSTWNHFEYFGNIIINVKKQY